MTVQVNGTVSGGPPSADEDKVMKSPLLAEDGTTIVAEENELLFQD